MANGFTFNSIAGVSGGDDELPVVRVYTAYKYENNKRTDEVRGTTMEMLMPGKDFHKTRVIVTTPVTLTQEAIDKELIKGNFYKATFTGYNGKLYTDRAGKMAVSATADAVSFRLAPLLEPLEID